MPVDAPDYVTLSAMITPALFITGNGSLIISTSNRMARIVDRMRILNDLGDRLGRGACDLDFPRERREHIDDQIVRLQWRADRIRIALVMLYAAFAAFVGTSLTIGLDVLSSHRVVGLPTALAILGVVLMLAAAVNLVREALEALRSNRAEVRFYHDLQRRRSRDDGGGAG